MQQISNKIAFKKAMREKFTINLEWKTIAILIISGFVASTVLILHFPLAILKNNDN